MVEINVQRPSSSSNHTNFDVGLRSTGPQTGGAICESEDENDEQHVQRHRVGVVRVCLYVCVCVCVCVCV